VHLGQQLLGPVLVVEGDPQIVQLQQHERVLREGIVQDVELLHRLGHFTPVGVALAEHQQRPLVAQVDFEQGLHGCNGLVEFFVQHVLHAQVLAELQTALVLEPGLDALDALGVFVQLTQVVAHTHELGLRVQTYLLD